MKKNIFIFSLLLLLIACDEDNVNYRFMSDEDTILTYFQKKTEYSEWYRLMERSGLSTAYNYSTTPITFFAVNNEVLNAYLKSNDWNSVDKVPIESAKLLIQYHTLVNVEYALDDFRDGKLREFTSSGDILSCKLVFGADKEDNGVFINRKSKIIVWDIEAVNGIIHELDRVIDPVKSDLYGFLVDNEDRFSILKEAYEETGLDSLLSCLVRSDVDMKCRRTLFVTSDTVFKQNGITSVSDLKGHLVKVGEVKDPMDALKLHLRYRILERDHSTAELGRILGTPILDKDGGKHPTVDQTTGLTIPTMAKNKLIQVRFDNNKYYFNESMFFVGDFYNMQSINGFVHEIDGVFDIFEPESILTLIEPSDHYYFNIYPEYRHPYFPNTYYSLDQKLFAPCITWKSTPENKENAVLYVINSGHLVNIGYQAPLHYMLYADMIEADLGANGEVTINSRPVPKGNYEVFIYVRRLKGEGGFFQAYLDGQKVGSTIEAGSTTSAACVLASIGEFSFTETRSHEITLKVVVPGILQWDCVYFKPLN